MPDFTISPPKHEVREETKPRRIRGIPPQRKVAPTPFTMSGGWRTLLLVRFPRRLDDLVRPRLGRSYDLEQSRGLHSNGKRIGNPRHTHNGRPSYARLPRPLSRISSHILALCIAVSSVPVAHMVPLTAVLHTHIASTQILHSPGGRKTIYLLGYGV